MNARTEVERHAGQDLPWSAAVGAGRTQDGTDSGETAVVAPNPWSGHAPDESRLSVDPLRATDRYRLVVPYTLRV